MTEAQKRAQKKYRKSSNYRKNWRNNWYRRRYGISYKEFRVKIKAQRNRCPIGNHLFGPRGSASPLAPCLDHDHKAHKNRAVLCREHNRGLGSFHESLRELRAAITYLKHWRK